MLPAPPAIEDRSDYLAAHQAKQANNMVSCVHMHLKCEVRSVRPRRHRSPARVVESSNQAMNLLWVSVSVSLQCIVIFACLLCGLCQCVCCA